MYATESRQVKGEQIARQFGWVRRVDEYSYKVHSQRGDFDYDVVKGEMGWLCSCPDAMYRQERCKHIIAVHLSFIVRTIVAQEPVKIQPVSVKNCPSCNSEIIVKHGIRRNKAGAIQRWSCKACGKWFVINLGFEGMRSTPQAITGAMQLYFTGESFRNVQKFLRLQGVNVSHITVIPGSVSTLTNIFVDIFASKVKNADEAHITSESFPWSDDGAGEATKFLQENGFRVVVMLK
jgi:transposase-like protein